MESKKITAIVLIREVIIHLLLPSSGSYGHGMRPKRGGSPHPARTKHPT
jgi:hypothetical protein